MLGGRKTSKVEDKFPQERGKLTRETYLVLVWRHWLTTCEIVPENLQWPGQSCVAFAAEHGSLVNPLTCKGREEGRGGGSVINKKEPCYH